MLLGAKGGEETELGEDEGQEEEPEETKDKTSAYVYLTMTFRKSAFATRAHVSFEKKNPEKIKVLTIRERGLPPQELSLGSPDGLFWLFFVGGAEVADNKSLQLSLDAVSPRIRPVRLTPCVGYTRISR